MSCTTKNFGRISSRIVTLIAVGSLLMGGVTAIPQPAHAVGDYNNAAIVDEARKYLGKIRYEKGKPLQCRPFVNHIIYDLSKGKQDIFTRNGNYFDPFIRAGGERIHEVKELVRGDIIQRGEFGTSSPHTYIIEERKGGDKFLVIDANYHYKTDPNRVTEHMQTVKLSESTRAFRMGKVTGAKTSQSATQAMQPTGQVAGSSSAISQKLQSASVSNGLQSTSQKPNLTNTSTSQGNPTTPKPVVTAAPAAVVTPAPAPRTWNETAGTNSNKNTWSNYQNASGQAGQQVGAGQTIQVYCRVEGHKVANGNPWWYKIASGPWNGGYYVSADSFYNNGNTSGSLKGTPFYDGNVPTC